MVLFGLILALGMLVDNGIVVIENTYRLMQEGYGPIQAVRGANMEIEQGEVVALLGPNGAGKSSLLRAIMGLHQISSGKITLNGQTISGKATEKIVKQGLTLTPEGRQVFSGLTVYENLKVIPDVDCAT